MLQRFERNVFECRRIRDNKHMEVKVIRAWQTITDNPVFLKKIRYLKIKLP